MTSQLTGVKVRLIPLLCVSLLTACGGAPKPEANSPSAVATTQQTTPAPSAAPEAPKEPAAASGSALTVPIESRSGSNLKGTIKLEAVSDGVRVVVDITSGPPGQHGAHIHQTADCSAPDAKSAGDHFNPEMHDHGLPPAAHRHLGDLGNIELDKDGKGHLEITIPGANLNPGDKLSFLDRAIIVHEKVDNGGQPTGNAGGRIGCGAIKR